MNDYKELISDLRHYYYDEKEALDAADAIEQLVKERNEWKTLGSLANKRAEDYRDMRRQRDEAIKERDNARRTLDQTLVLLNDETVRADRLEAENSAKEQYIAETIGKVIKERDAAIADLKDNKIYNKSKNLLLCKTRNCSFCKHYFSDDAAQFCEAIESCGNWEWRGVQEAEHENA